MAPAEVAEAATPAEPSAPPKLKVKKDILGKAVRALVQVVKKRQAGGNQLFESTGETMTVLFTLGLVPQKRKMRPFMIQLPHPMYDETSEVCFFSSSPQKQWKELLMKQKSIPGLSKVIGLDKLQRNYQTLETKKALCEAFDLFICDAKITEMMPQALGKIFFKEKNKIPLPIKMNGKPEEGIARCLGGTPFRIPAGPCLGVKIGRCGMPEEHLAENAAVVISAVAKILHEHKNYVQSVSVQATNAPALPVWRREVTPGDLVDPKSLKKGKKIGDPSSSSASETGPSSASETEGLDISEMPSDAGETLSTRDTVSEQETETTRSQSEMDTEAGDEDSESAPSKQEMPLVKGLKKRAARRRGLDEGVAAAAVAKRAAESEAKSKSENMAPPTKKAKKKAGK